jgi:hypothetical protein
LDFQEEKVIEENFSLLMIGRQGKSIFDAASFPPRTCALLKGF